MLIPIYKVIMVRLLKYEIDVYDKLTKTITCKDK